MKPTFYALPDTIRYGFVGIINNVLVYLVYVFITYFWLNPKLAITLFYPIGAITAYLGHMKYSFTYKGKSFGAVVRFFIVYFFGYALNLFLLFVLSDTFNFPHQVTQAIAIPVVAGVLFFMLKYFVFPYSENRGIA